MKLHIVKLVPAVALSLLLIAATGIPAGATGYRGSGSPDFLYYMEGTGAYFLPDSDADIFFNLGRWYRRSGSSWSVSVALGGPWGSISVSSVPRVLVDLPPDFRSTHHLGRVPYGHVVGPGGRDDDYGRRYYSGPYYDDHDRRGYQRRWHSGGQFWFFVAPGFDDDHWDDSHRGRRGRGRGRGRD
jgi:hypothetical protein